MPFLNFAAERNLPAAAVTRISVMASGKIFFDGKEVTLSAFKKALAGVKGKNGVVWYYRESGRGEPPAEAVQVFKLLVENKLPISLSTKADFSDYVDEMGKSHPRR